MDAKTDRQDLEKLIIASQVKVDAPLSFWRRLILFFRVMLFPGPIKKELVATISKDRAVILKEMEEAVESFAKMADDELVNAYRQMLDPANKWTLARVNALIGFLASTWIAEKTGHGSEDAPASSLPPGPQHQNNHAETI